MVVTAGFDTEPSDRVALEQLSCLVESWRQGTFQPLQWPYPYVAIAQKFSLPALISFVARISAGTTATGTLNEVDAELARLQEDAADHWWEEIGLAGPDGPVGWPASDSGLNTDLPPEFLALGLRHWATDLRQWLAFTRVDCAPVSSRVRAGSELLSEKLRVWPVVLTREGLRRGELPISLLFKANSHSIPGDIMLNRVVRWLGSGGITGVELELWLGWHAFGIPRGAYGSDIDEHTTRALLAEWWLQTRQARQAADPAWRRSRTGLAPKVPTVTHSYEFARITRFLEGDRSEYTGIIVEQQDQDLILGILPGDIVEIKFSGGGKLTRRIIEVETGTRGGHPVYWLHLRP